MGARTPADPQTSTFASQKCSGVVVKCSKRPVSPNRHIESPAGREPIDSPSLSLGGRRVPNVDSNLRLDQTSWRSCNLCSLGFASVATGSNNLGPCDLFSSYFVVDLPRNVEALGPEPSGLFGTSFWGEFWNVFVSHLRFIIVALMVPKCTCSSYNYGDGSSSSLLDTN